MLRWSMHENKLHFATLCTLKINAQCVYHWQVVGQLAAFTDELGRYGAAPPNAVRRHTPALLADTWLSLLS